MPSSRPRPLLAGAASGTRARAPGLSPHGANAGLRLGEVAQPARIAGRSLAASAMLATPASRSV